MKRSSSITCTDTTSSYQAQKNNKFQRTEQNKDMQKKRNNEKIARKYERGFNKKDKIQVAQLQKKEAQAN